MVITQLQFMLTKFTWLIGSSSQGTQGVHRTLRTKGFALQIHLKIHMDLKNTIMECFILNCAHFREVLRFFAQLLMHLNLCQIIQLRSGRIITCTS